jgi:glycosyltransferase involved in cell wall biosynthesis
MKGQAAVREFLYVAHNFPPLIGAGVARSEQNCRLLPEYGWRPTLLTATADNSDEVDRRYGERGIEILRASGIIRENRVRALPRGVGKQKASLSTELQRWLAGWLLVPDRQVLWKLPAQQKALDAARRHNWEFIFGTLPPVSAGWIGKWVAQRLGLPFILEWRDVVNDAHAPTGLHRAAICSIERSLVRSAESIVVVSTAMKKWVVDKRDAAPNVVNVVTTGFMPQDKELFARLARAENERFTMLYVGVFVRERRPDIFLRAVRSLIDRNIIGRDRIRVIFVGNLASSAISDFGLEGVGETVYMVPHDEVFKWYAQADLLLMFCPKREYQSVTYPGKLFEYLATGKPILGLVDKESDTAKVLEKSGLGLVADADDVEEVSSKVEYAYRLWERNEFTMRPDKKFIERFDGRDKVKELASVFEDVVCACRTKRGDKPMVNCKSGEQV